MYTTTITFPYATRTAIIPAVTTTDAYGKLTTFLTREFVLQAAIYPTFPYPIVLTSPKTTITVIVPPITITDDDGNEVVMAEINGSSHSLTSASIIISKLYHSLTTNIPSSKARPGSIISSNSADTSFTTTYTVSGKTRVAIVFYSV